MALLSGLHRTMLILALLAGLMNPLLADTDGASAPVQSDSAYSPDLKVSPDHESPRSRTGKMVMLLMEGLLPVVAVVVSGAVIWFMIPIQPPEVKKVEQPPVEIPPLRAVSRRLTQL